MNDHERVEVLRGALRSILAVTDAQDLPSAMRSAISTLAQTALSITGPFGRPTLPAGQVFCENCGEAVGHSHEHWDDLDGPNVAGWGCHKKVDCPNCGVRVPYGSFHCRGSDELNAFYTCQRR